MGSRRPPSDLHNADVFSDPGGGFAAARDAATDPAALIAGSAVAAIVTDPRRPDNPIVACNAAFEALTGYARGDVLGRNCRLLAGPETDPADAAVLRAAIRAARPVIGQILNYRRDGTPFRNAVMIAPVFGPDGSPIWFLGSQVEVAPARAPTNDAFDARDRLARLNDRQQKVLAAMARGALNKQIAWDLGVSERTVKLHRAAMMRVLGVRTSADAIRLAVEAGL